MRQPGENGPLIGVSWVNPHQKESQRYLTVVQDAGGEPVPLLAEADSWQADLELVRGLLLTGGGDVDPRLYDEDNSGLSVYIDPHRDELELAALRFCLARGLPVLAICRGMQLVNVALGGSLVQDLQSGVEHRPIGRDSSFHRIEVIPGTALAAIVGSNSKPTVNSRHHQGVERRRLAPTLRCSALAPDGIVEGLELAGDQFLLGVQCHPERTDEVSLLQGLFTTLVRHALSS